MTIGKRDRFKSKLGDLGKFLCAGKSGRTGKFVNIGRLGNEGVTLVEILVVISIMAILTGAVSMGISLAFSKDAAQCASKLNDAISEARMLSMSKEGDFALKITTADGKYLAVISGGINKEQSDGTTTYNETYREEISLEGDSASKKIKSIVYNSGGSAISDSNEVTIVFDKTKGNVYKVNGVKLAEDANSIMTFDITPQRGTRTAKVSLVTSTGKHTVGDF